MWWCSKPNDSIWKDEMKSQQKWKSIELNVNAEREKGDGGEEWGEELK